MPDNSFLGTTKGGAFVEGAMNGSQFKLNHISNKSDPTIRGQQLLADFINQVFPGSRPTEISANHVIEPNTVAAREQGTPASDTLLGRLLAGAAKRLGGQVTKAEFFDARGKTGIRAEVTYECE